MDLKKNMFGWLMLLAWLPGFRLWGEDSPQYSGKVHFTNRQLLLTSVSSLLKCTHKLWSISERKQLSRELIILRRTLPLYVKKKRTRRTAY